MRALSIQQPFASLIVAGLKQLETRPWTTDYRGILLIHACYRTDAPESMVRYGNKLLSGIGRNVDHLPRSSIIGAVQLTATHSPRERSLDPDIRELITNDEEILGFWSLSYWTWQLTNPIEFDRPIGFPGNLGLWEPAPWIIKRCRQFLANVA